jgi:hypothetical protein
VTSQLAAIVMTAARGHGLHVPLIILGTLVVIAAAACCYAWQSRR